MPSSQNQAESDRSDEIFLAFKEWLGIQEARLGSVPYSPKYGSSESHQKEFHVSPGIAPGEPLISLNPRGTGFQGDGRPPDKRSVARRLLRTFALGVIVIVVACAALAWQSTDEKTKDIVRAWGISLGQLSSLLGTKPAATPDAASGAISKGSEQGSAATRPSPEPQYQLEAMANDLSVMRRMLEQLAAKQEQMAQDIATVQAAEQKIGQQRAALPQPSASRNVHSEPTLQQPLVSVPIPRPRAPLPLQ